MKFVFWSNADERILDYVRLNSSHQDISHRFPYFLAYSGRRSPEAEAPLGPGATVLEAPDNWSLRKARLVIDEVRGEDFDVLVHLDMDAIVFDLPWLLRLAALARGRQLIGPVAGNGAGRYVRGGCHAASRDLVENLRLPDEAAGLDFLFNEHVKKVPGHRLVHVPLFEETVEYQGAAPVWHPKKRFRDAAQRLESFGEHVRLYNERRHGTS